MIKLYASLRRAFCLNQDLLTTGSVGIPVRFGFSDEWEGLGKVAVFRGSGKSVDVVLTGEECCVPPEVLTDAGGVLSIGVYGTDGEETVIPTVYVEAGEILPGAELSDNEPEELTPSLVAQILAALEDALDEAEYAADLAESVRDDADEGMFDGREGATGAPGADGTTFTPSVSSAGVLSWTNDGNKQNPQSVDLTAAVLAALPYASGVSF